MQRNQAIAAIKADARWREITGDENDPLIDSRFAKLSNTGVPLRKVDPYDGLTGFSKDMAVLKTIIFSGWINFLLLCIPVSYASKILAWGAVPTFVLSFLSLIPLALILGDVTEDLALRFGDVIGGLLNATFGNVVEVILSIAALEKGLYTVVAASLVGSILSNLLLVLGCCFLFGGLRYKKQSFNAMSNRVCSSLLFLAVIGIVMPTAAFNLVHDHQAKPTWILDISRITAVIMLLVYACYLVFQLATHKELFDEGDDGEEGGDEDEEEPQLSLTASLGILTTITVLVAFASEFLTGSIQEVSSSTGLGEAFLGMIVLPVAGNACEHITAVIVSMKNKMDLALGVAMGSSLQIALFALPLCVVVGWATGHAFSLELDPFMALVLTVSVIHASIITNDANSHWLQGVQLLAVYIIIGVSYVYQ